MNKLAVRSIELSEQLLEETPLRCWQQCYRVIENPVEINTSEKIPSLPWFELSNFLFAKILGKFHRHYESLKLQYHDSLIVLLRHGVRNTAFY